MIRIKPLSVCVLIVFLTITSASIAGENSDGKLWISQAVDYSFGKTKAVIEINERFYNGISEWEELYVDMGVDIKVAPWFVLGPRYRHVRARFGSGDEAIENRVHVNLEFKGSLGSIAFAIRTKFEHRMFNNNEKKHRMTERIKLSCPILVSGEKLGIKLFLSHELYFDLDQNEANNHETQAGLVFHFSKNYAMKFFSGHELKKKAVWNYHTHILGLGLDLSY